MELSFQELATIVFLVLVTLWLFIRPRETSDRVFLAIAGLIYIGVMILMFLTVGRPVRRGLPMIAYLVLDTTGLILVWVSRKLLKKKSDTPEDSCPKNQPPNKTGS